MAANETPKCLVTDCQRTPRSRGLCDIHYTQIAMMVKRGKFTWPQLEEAGKALPSKVKKSPSMGIKEWLKGL